jgi:hypothetical protein
MSKSSVPCKRAMRSSGLFWEGIRPKHDLSWVGCQQEFGGLIETHLTTVDTAGRGTVFIWDTLLRASNVRSLSEAARRKNSREYTIVVAGALRTES